MTLSWCCQSDFGLPANTKPPHLAPQLTWVTTSCFSSPRRTIDLDEEYSFCGQSTPSFPLDVHAIAYVLDLFFFHNPLWYPHLNLQLHWFVAFHSSIHLQTWEALRVPLPRRRSASRHFSHDRTQPRPCRLSQEPNKTMLLQRIKSVMPSQTTMQPQNASMRPPSTNILLQ